MGCCSNNIKFSKMDFVLELYDLIQDKDKPTKFQLKKLQSINLEKMFDKTLSYYIKVSDICRNLDEDFKFNINNSLFYCYLDTKYAVIKNFLQIKDFVPFGFENLYKISIVLMQNFNNLYIPKIYFVNKTKSEDDLNGLKIDFSDDLLNRDYIFNPDLSKDKIIFSKPNLFNEIDDINENQNENEIEDNKIEENDLELKNELEEKKSNDTSIYEDDQEENNSNSNIESENEEDKESKNYILIKDEITHELVKNVFDILSPYIDENDDLEFKNVVKLDDKNGKMRRFRRFGSFVGISLELNKNISLNNNRRKSLVNNDMVIVKKGEELKLNLFNNEKERNNKEKKEEEEQNKIINSIFIENVIISDLEVFAEMIGILAIYNPLKRISFCDFKLEKEKEKDIWDNIIYLLQENNNIRWVDLHKTNMNNEILNLIAKICENKRFRYLDLSENFIDEKGTIFLHEFLSKNKTLQRLILNNNDLENFKKIGVENICKGLENHPNIQLLDISSMILTGCGQAISNLIKNTKSIRHIILKECLLNFKDIQIICKALSLPNISKTIINVDMSYNNMASDKSIEEIGKMIKANKTLTHLNLEKMNLTINTYNFIFNALNENDKMNHFNFSYNPDIRPRIILEYFLHRKKLNSLTYIPYNANINEKGPKVEFNLEERKIIKKFKDKRKRVKLTTTN